MKLEFDENWHNTKELYLSNKDITELPAELWTLTQLTHLDLSNNQLNSLPETICNLRSLICLNLNNNNLRTFPSRFTEIHNLKYLYLVNNSFTSLPDELAKLTNLEILLTTGNPITEIDIELIRRFPYAAKDIIDFLNNQIDLTEIQGFNIQQRLSNSETNHINLPTTLNKKFRRISKL